MKNNIHPDLYKLLEEEKLINELDSNPSIKSFVIKLNEDWIKKESELSSLRPVIDVIPNTISWIKRDLTYIGVNLALANMCKLKPVDFVGKFVGFHSHDRIIYDFAFELFQGKSKSLVRRIESNINNLSKVFLLIGTMVHDDESIVIGVDITELEGLKSHVQFSEKLVTLGELFAGIIHDMNNPLTLIEGHVYRLKKLYPNEVALLESLDKISSSVFKITKLTKSIRAFARNDKGEAVYEEEIYKLIEDARMMIEHKVMNIKLEISDEFKSFNYVGNISEMFRVFLNLLSNAVDALNDLDIANKWIRVELELNADELNILFIDAGKGIPEAVADKIFEPFYTTKPLGKGTGIGLSLARKIVVAEGGDLLIDKSSENTTFRLKIPKNRFKKI